MRPFLLPAIVACLCPSLSAAAPALKPKAPASEKVDKLFAAMRDGTYRQAASPGFGFPDLGWEDVPALLARAGEERELAAYPTNPISSFGQRGCREGVMALWLVEGVRRGGKFPSLNPLFAGAKDTAGPTDEEHRQALQAYRDWWGKVKDRSPMTAREVDPLAGSGLRWR
jgi:hypothetical protein